MATGKVTGVKRARCGPWDLAELLFQPIVAGFFVFKESRYPDLCVKYPDF